MDIRGGMLIGDMFTDPVGIKEYAKDKGLNAEIYVDGNLDEVRWFVDRGIPVMLFIIATAGSTDIDPEGHYVVAISFCEVPRESPPGTYETVVGVYCPHGRQFAITPERLNQFWGKQEFWGVGLWNRLYIAISDQDLPPGNTDKVEAQLAMARGVETFVTGAGDILVSPFEGGLEIVGGVYGTVSGLLCMGYMWLGDNVPLVGGFFSAVGEFSASMTLIIDDLLNIYADLADPATWLDPEKLGELFVDLVTVVADVIVAAVEFIVDIVVEGILGLLSGLWDGIKAFGCWALGWGCPETIVYYKHYVSTDPCLETTTFVNGLHRVEALGYIYTYPALGTKPIWLYTDANSTASNRAYYLHEDGDWQQNDRSKVNLGMIGYSLASEPDPTNSVNLTETALNTRMFGGGDLGYLLRLPEDGGCAGPQSGTTILWRMAPVEESELEGWYQLSQNSTVSTDPCAMTQTFITPIAQGYTRELPVGFIPPSETEGAVRLFRFYNPDLEDCLLSTSSTSPEGYVNQGYLGYIYTEQGTDMVPLYQFYNSKYRDHLVTTDPNAEDLGGYDSQELLGYVLSTANIEPEDWTCNTPIWRFCKRIEKKE